MEERERERVYKGLNPATELSETKAGQSFRLDQRKLNSFHLERTIFDWIGHVVRPRDLLDRRFQTTPHARIPFRRRVSFSHLFRLDFIR